MLPDLSTLQPGARTDAYALDLAQPLFHPKKGSGTAPSKTGNYVFCDVPDAQGNLVRHWVFVRKIQRQARKRRPLKHSWDPPRPTGAAGTPEQYWGKWASLGGAVEEKARTLYEAAVMEMNAEAAIHPPLRLREVKIRTDHPQSQIEVANPRAELVYAQGLDHNMGPFPVGVFVFRWLDPADFVRHFPAWPNHHQSLNIVMKSHSECDAVTSMTAETMIMLQTQEMQRKGKERNFFTDYTWDTFWTEVVPAAQMFNPAFAAEMAKRRYADEQERYPWEFPGVTPNDLSAALYREVRFGEYDWAI